MVKKKLQHPDNIRIRYHVRKNFLSVKTTKKNKKIRLALICGGPSPERGISLNSARSCLDHLSHIADILPIYVDPFQQYYLLSKAALYSNTPADFDFKIDKHLTQVNEKELQGWIKEHVDLVFPCIHGHFGEDGRLQAILEKYRIPFIGSSAQSCARVFPKDVCARFLKQNNYPSIPALVLTKQHTEDPKKLIKLIENFRKKHTSDRLIVKPTCGGSSLGVSCVHSAKQASKKVNELLSSFYHNSVLIEPFCSGQEFTVIVLESLAGEPVALIPTQIIIDRKDGHIFNYRRKYLPTANTVWACPPHFSDATIQTIRHQAESLFTLFKLHDFARLAGWLLDDGRIVFSDINPISGMEQNSFMFKQASLIGMTHQNLLWHVVSRACRRLSIPILNPSDDTHQGATRPSHTVQKPLKKQTVCVLFGGDTKERQVSLMSGTNVWLKLRQSSYYNPQPYLLAADGYLWRLSYPYCLNHTVEETIEHCQKAQQTIARIAPFFSDIKQRLQLNEHAIDFDPTQELPYRLSLDTFLKEAHDKKHFIFLALHGGRGENGWWQQKLDENGLFYNGSLPKPSELCMDKYASGLMINRLSLPSLSALPKIHFVANLSKPSAQDCLHYWSNWVNTLKTKDLIIKPRADGCSAHVCRLQNAQALENFFDEFIKQQHQCTITRQRVKEKFDHHFIIEPYWVTDKLTITDKKLHHIKTTGWLEMTVGILEKNDHYLVLPPSITVPEQDILSLEDKFQGGTGINQ